MKRMIPAIRRWIRRWIRRNFDNVWLSVWKVTFAMVALLDMQVCSSLLGWSGWKGSASTTTTTNALPLGESSLQQQQQHWIAIFFCACCVCESLVRARQAQVLANENHALDAFEQTLQRAYSTTRVSFFKHGVDEHLDQQVVKATLRTYVPAVSVILFWLCLLPTSVEYGCGNDTAWMTTWIHRFFTNYTVFSDWLQELASKILWQWILPFKLYQPRRFLGRLRKVLRFIRYLRFGFPLFRMGLKLNDQFMALSKMWRQSIAAQAERARRMARPSLLLEDLRRVESLAKVQTALAALPSRLFQYSQDQLSEISHGLQRRQLHGRRLQRQFQRLKRDIAMNLESSNHYDRIVQLTQELKQTLHTTILSSHHLLSPRTRFSVMWRMTVTNVLMIEVVRLMISWRLSGTFKITLSQMITRLLIECEHPERMRRRLAFFTNPIDDFRKRMSHAIPLLPTPNLLTICVPSSPSAALFLQLGAVVENFIDVVSFLDIFIWFHTGDLDGQGVIVPKPFFTRCILPGTLVQVLDHPTLPDALPSFIRHLMDVCNTIGWSRAIRWALAIGPVLRMLFQPFKDYFFGHVDSMKGMMSYAESYGLIATSRPSAFMYKYPMFGDSIRSHSSQVGLSYDLGDSVRSHSIRTQSDQIGLSVDHPSTVGSVGRRLVTPYMQHAPPAPPTSPLLSNLRRRTIHFSDVSNDDERLKDNESYSFGYSPLDDPHQD